MKTNPTENLSADPLQSEDSDQRLVRPEFVAQMEAELQANQHKGDWRRWYPTPLQVLAEIQHHQSKLMLALSAGDCERVKEYSADLANFAMKVDEQFGGPNSFINPPRSSDNCTYPTSSNDENDESNPSNGKDSAAMP